MRPRGAETRRARQVMVTVFFLAIIAGLVYIIFNLTGEPDRTDVPSSEIHKIEKELRPLKTNAYTLKVHRA